MVKLTDADVAEIKELAHEQLIYDTLTMFSWIDRARKVMRRVTQPEFSYPAAEASKETKHTV